MDEVSRSVSSQQYGRVKVYLLGQFGNWDDCGAGTLVINKVLQPGGEKEYLEVIPIPEVTKNPSQHVEPDRLEKLKGERINEKSILYLPILASNQYDKQSDSIISWVDQNLQEEIAISFLESHVFREVWKKICQRIGRDLDEDKCNKYKDLDKLIMPNMENLEQIRTELETKRNWMVQAILKNNEFLDKLSQVFHDLEDLESFNNLHTIYDIIRLLIFSEDVALLELLLSEKFYLLVFGALEYDSGIPKSTKPKYREFLLNHTVYKKVLDFKNEIIMEKIRLNYRISYLKDSVISSIVDDPLTSTFNPVSYNTNHFIFEYIMANDHYLDDLFLLMDTNLQDAIGFLYELVQIVKMLLNMDEKIEFCDKLVKKNLFTIIGKALFAFYSSNNQQPIEEDKKVILKIDLIEILYYTLQLEFAAFIEFLKTSPNSKLLIDGIIQNFFHGDQGLQIQTGELLKFLIDIMHEKRNEMLDVFYDIFLPQFIDHYKNLENNEYFFSYVQQFVEILIHCLKTHGYRIRHYIISHKLLHKLYPGFQLKEKSVYLAIIRLVKHIALSKDEFLIKYVSNNNLLDDIFELYVKNAHRNNLIHSVCLEFFTVLWKSNIKLLIIEFVERFRSRINELGLKKVFLNMFNKYEQMAQDEENELPQTQEFTNGNKLSGGAERAKYNKFTPMEIESLEEEEYFDNEDDEKKEEFNQENNKNGVKPESVETNFSASKCLATNQNLFSEENSIADTDSAKSTVQRIAEKIKSLKSDAEESSKGLFAKQFSQKKLSEKGGAGKMQVEISIKFDSTHNSLDMTNGKRQGSDLTNDEDIVQEGQIGTQKKVKTNP